MCVRVVELPQHGARAHAGVDVPGALLRRQRGEEALGPGLDVGDDGIGIGGAEDAVDGEMALVAIEAEVDRVHHTPCSARGGQVAFGIGAVVDRSGTTALPKPAHSSDPRCEPAALDAQADAPVGLVIEVGVRLEERQALGLRPAVEAVDEVVAVALDVGQAEQRDQRQVLLHREARLRRQVLARQEVAAVAALGIPEPAARQVDERLVEALAVLRRDAAVAERAGAHEGVELAVGLVDDHRPIACQRRDAARERDLALDRLLDEERRRAELLQRRLGLHRAPQGDDRIDVLVLLVAVERDVQRPGDAVEHRRRSAPAARGRRAGRR